MIDTPAAGEVDEDAARAALTLLKLITRRVSGPATLMMLCVTGLRWHLPVPHAELKTYQDIMLAGVGVNLLSASVLAFRAAWNR